eukprot:10770196-Ditylum_brightwellii.AAC.1
MKDERKDLVDFEGWEVIDESDIPVTPVGIRKTLIDITWVFKVKRFPDGSVKKYKACLCVRDRLARGGRGLYGISLQMGGARQGA